MGLRENRVYQAVLQVVDPTRQSPFAFKWTWVSFIGVGLAAWLLFLWKHAWPWQYLFDNVFVYFPTYLIHEFAHRIAWGLFHSQTISLWAGPMAQLFLPGILLCLCWRISGGRWLCVVGWYYWGTCLYGTGQYCADARAMTLHLTSSDMLSSAGPGTPGDWYYMLKPLGLLPYDTLMGAIFDFAGAVCIVLAFYSLWYYWEHLNDFMRQDLKPNPYRQAAIPPISRTHITMQDYQQDPFTGKKPFNPWDEPSIKK